MAQIPRRPTLPVPTPDDFAALEEHLAGAEWVLRGRRFFPRTVAVLEDLQQRISGEERRISHDRDEAAAKKQLTDRLRAQAAMVR